MRVGVKLVVGGGLLPEPRDFPQSVSAGFLVDVAVIERRQVADIQIAGQAPLFTKECFVLISHQEMNASVFASVHTQDHDLGIRCQDAHALGQSQVDVVAAGGAPARQHCEPSAGALPGTPPWRSNEPRFGFESPVVQAVAPVPHAGVVIAHIRRMEVGGHPLFLARSRQVGVEPRQIGVRDAQIDDRHRGRDLRPPAAPAADEVGADRVEPREQDLPQV